MPETLSMDEWLLVVALGAFGWTLLVNAVIDKDTLRTRLWVGGLAVWICYSVYVLVREYWPT